MSTEKKLSDTQREAVRRMTETGADLVRFYGGLWSTRGIAVSRDVPVWWVGIQTVRALERLGVIERRHESINEWNDSRRLIKPPRSREGETER